MDCGIRPRTEQAVERRPANVVVVSVDDHQPVAVLHEELVDLLGVLWRSFETVLLAAVGLEVLAEYRSHDHAMNLLTS